MVLGIICFAFRGVHVCWFFIESMIKTSCPKSTNAFADRTIVKLPPLFPSPHFIRLNTIRTCFSYFLKRFKKLLYKHNIFTFKKSVTRTGSDIASKRPKAKPKINDMGCPPLMFLVFPKRHYIELLLYLTDLISEHHLLSCHHQEKVI